MTGDISQLGEQRPEGAWEKALILGLDGFSLRLVDELLPAGTMPRLAALLRQGAAGPLRSVFPTHSAAAWSSFFTGQRPGRHGVFDFMDRGADGRYRHSRPAADACFWRVLERHGLRTGLFNFPATFPPSPIAGFMAAGMLVPDGAVWTYPPELSTRLKTGQQGYRIDLKWQLYAGREPALLRDLERMEAQQLAAVQELARDIEVDCLAVAFLGPDRLHHALWRHLDPEHPDHDPSQAARLRDHILGYYCALDAAVGQLLDAAQPGTGVIVLSDHGFQAAGCQFRVDDWLAGHGWLTFGRSASWVRLARRLDVPWIQHLRRRLVADVSRHAAALAPGGTYDWPHTVAYCPWTVQQAIRLNLRGRDPYGVVTPGHEARELLADIRRALLETRDPATGRPVVAEVIDGAAIFGQADPKGCQASPLRFATGCQANPKGCRAKGSDIPDLVLTTRPGYATSPHHPRLWQRASWPSGDHSLEGMWAVAEVGGGGAPGLIRAQRPFAAELVDVAPTLYYLLGLPIPAGLDGRPQVELVEPSRRWPVRMDTATVTSLAAGPGESDTPALTPDEEDDMRDRLRGLGYLP